MDTFFEFLSNNELLVVYYLLGAVVVLLVTVIAFDQITKRRRKNLINREEFELYNTSSEDANYEIHEVEEDNLPDVDMQVAASDILDQINIDEVRKNIEHTQEIEEIKYVDEDEELERTQAQLELQALKEELNKLESPLQEDVVEKEEIVPEIKVEEMIPIIEDVIEDISEEQIDLTEVSQEDKIEEYESLQEQEAIISLEDLEKASATISDEQLLAYEDTGEEPISIQELEQLYKNADESTDDAIKQDNVTKVEMYDEFMVTTKPAEETYNENREFKATPVISPVFGVEASTRNIALEQTANYDKLNDEIRKTNEFLVALKELRKNLD